VPEQPALSSTIFWLYSAAFVLLMPADGHEQPHTSPSRTAAQSFAEPHD
jgi:hypothetical protein